MPWGNPRTTTPQWRRLRRLILERDGYTCQATDCPDRSRPADEVDHIDGNHLNDNPANLRAIHDNPCHRRKSSAEGNAEQARLRALRRRPVEQHPGLRLDD